MTVKPFDREKHYHLLKEWWNHWETPILPLEDLPETGFMAIWDDKPILCAFLVLTNAKFAMAETVCANPETSHEDREVAIIRLSEVMGDVARELGFNKLIAVFHKERLVGKLLSAGFVLSDQTYLCRKGL